MPETDLLIANGVDGSTGNYLLPAIDLQAAKQYIQQVGMTDDTLLRWTQDHERTATTLRKEFPPDLDPTDVSQVGWGILYAPDLDPLTKEALQKLVNYRRQRSADPRMVKEFTFEGDIWAYKWLNRQGVSTGVYDPYQVPYYLLIAGSPKSIPFSFGFQLNVGYAVGRLYFDTPEEYARYIDSLIAYEQAAEVTNRHEIVYFAPSHDPATNLSTSQLIAPLLSGMPAAEHKPAVKPVAEAVNFSSQAYLGGNASKARLKAIFASPPQERVPALLFTASHGLGVPQTNPDQAVLNGALLCQSWSSPGSIDPDDYFAGYDLPPEARLGGMITIHFACYGGGTPDHDRYAKMVKDLPDYSAKDPFIAALPRRLLAHPNGGALACLAHIDRLFTTSIDSERSGPRYQPYRNILYRLMQGQPAGHLNREFSRLSAHLDSDLNALLDYGKIGGQVKSKDLVPMWIERNDTGSFLVLGDPAARLRVAEPPKAGRG
ncbi:MAG: hypothetical protein MUC85_05605 [Anaerolineales bacterium]|nr:hypothetical protein [Anaerolineales bacterium]